MSTRYFSVMRRNTAYLDKRLAQLLSERRLLRAAQVMAPTLVALSFAGASSVARAQGAMDFSGAQTLMGTFNARFAYVSISRGSLDVQIFTDFSLRLAERLTRDVTRSSAIVSLNEVINKKNPQTTEWGLALTQ